MRFMSMSSAIPPVFLSIRGRCAGDGESEMTTSGPVTGKSGLRKLWIVGQKVISELPLWVSGRRGREHSREFGVIWSELFVDQFIFLRLGKPCLWFPFFFLFW